MPTKQIEVERINRWAAALRIGMAVAEGTDALEQADRIQILDANGIVLYTRTIAKEEVA